MSLLDIAGQQNPGGPEAVKAAGEAEWAELQAAAAPEPEPGRRAGRRAPRPRPPRRKRTSGRTSGPARRRRLPRPRRRPRPRRPPRPARRRRPPTSGTPPSPTTRRARYTAVGAGRAGPEAPSRSRPPPEPEPPAPPPVAPPPEPERAAGRRRRSSPSPSRPSRRPCPTRAPAAGRGPAAPPLPARKAGGFLDAGAIRAAAEGQGLRLPGSAYAAVAAALASGRHVVLTGAAGSGKTMLALAIAKAAVTSGRSTGAVLVTPAARWSSGEALGRRAPPDGTPATTGKVPDAAVPRQVARARRARPRGRRQGARRPLDVPRRPAAHAAGRRGGQAAR